MKKLIIIVCLFTLFTQYNCTHYFEDKLKITNNSKEDVFFIKIPKSALGKFHLVAKAVFFNGEKFTYEVDIDEYFLNKIREKKFL